RRTRAWVPLSGKQWRRSSVLATASRRPLFLSLAQRRAFVRLNGIERRLLTSCSPTSTSCCFRQPRRGFRAQRLRPAHRVCRPRTRSSRTTTVCRRSRSPAGSMGTGCRLACRSRPDPQLISRASGSGCNTRQPPDVSTDTRRACEAADSDGDVQFETNWRYPELRLVLFHESADILLRERHDISSGRDRRRRAADGADCPDRLAGPPGEASHRVLDRRESAVAASAWWTSAASHG